METSKSNTSNNVSKGRIGEDLATKFLEEKGFKVIDRNWHYSRNGEIDIIAMDKKSLVFIEVKTRTSNRFGEPIESITSRKMNKIKLVAGAYLNEKTDIKYSEIRFDAIGIILSKEPKIDYFRDIYQF